MTTVLIKLKKLNSSDWPRLTCSTKRNRFLSYDVTYTEGLNKLSCPLVDRCLGIQFSSENCIDYTNFRVEEEESDIEDEDDEEYDRLIGDCDFLSD